MTGEKLRLVIFDCDGVLIDSETISARITAEEVSAIGWGITPAEARAHFLGRALPDMLPIIAAHVPEIPPGWGDRLLRRLVLAMQTEAVPVPGAAEMLRATNSLGLDWRVASNSSHAEMTAKFNAAGLADLVAGRLHSAADVGRGKPAPDLFLAAARAGSAPPSACLVVEDSVPGVRGALAAGMSCLGFAAHGDGPALSAAGAVLFDHLADLPALFRRAMRKAA